MTLGFVDGEYQDGDLRGCTFIAGQRGMGKTYEMARLLGLCGGGVLFFDSLSKHAPALAGYRLISQPGELSEYLALNRGRRFRVLYQPRMGNLDEHFAAVCQCVRAVGWMIFAVDELDMLCGPRHGDSRMCPELYHLVNYGRHERVSMLATARQPMSVARGYTAACGEMRLFHMREKSYLRYFAEWIGEEDAARLTQLQKFEYLHWTDNGPSILHSPGVQN